MSQINSREIALLSSQTLTTSGTGPDVPIPMVFGAVIVSVALTTVSGTSPTFNFFVQNKLRQAASTDTSGVDMAGATGSIYDDLLAFAQYTTSGIKIARLIYSPIAAGTPSTSGSLAVGVDYANLDGSLTAGNYRLGALGSPIRIKWVIAGTSPSGVAAVSAQFLPYGM